MPWRVVGLCIAVLLYLYGLACVYLYLNQRRLIYMPQSSRKLQQAPDFVLSRDAVALRGWGVNPGQTKALLYFGGNAGRIEDLREDFSHRFPGRQRQRRTHRVRIDR